ncbi:16S rRNA (cytosine(967)-C(5))-methyltransferase RsmB [Hydrogenophaga sp.]|uniref:16S rRNA (cytosine(967)-C(5))-methyltransferase RsmB n=1 Tax=Hydrogenophaga sp. TaxID=1904254 RepID=UPI002632F7FE|nr:16S rRNA (cytosine(967)-C(5))-methyltransferase RsmB [Hydrogenophaga sp.]MDM7951525.1 16S rRNA (cytosine(967)-C(5))-methyltransferase RsmB [Hydrogenophaga sp.]
MTPSLATQLHHTARCVLAVEQGHSLSEILPQVAADLRPGVQALTFHVLRRLGTCRALVARLAPRKPDPAVRAMLCCAVALLVDEPGVEPATTAALYPPHTVVNQAVEAVRQQRSTQRAAAFVNACLRRLLRERDALMQAVSADVEARWNHPSWWVELLQRDHPDHWQAILQANNLPGPMTLRVNRRLTDVASYQQALLALGMPARRVGDDGLELEAPQPVDRLPGFADGLCSVQDAAAQLAAPLLLAGREGLAGARVLDACAAPGGKTAHLLERADLDLLALDLDPKRCNRVTDTLKRLRLHAEVRTADAAHPAGWWDGRPFDAILLDAPCTASGIVRRHPDVRWLRRASDVAQLAAVQQQLLEALWPLVKPGGRLVYATCSVFRTEGSGQVTSFLERHTEAVLWPSPGHLLPGNVGDPAGFHDNEPGGPDGFFYARIDKALA